MHANKQTLSWDKKSGSYDTSVSSNERLISIGASPTSLARNGRPFDARLERARQMPGLQAAPETECRFA